MMRSNKSWLPKLKPEQKAKIVRERRGRMLIPTPLLVARVVKRVPPGRLITAVTVRARLARAARADLTCPMTTGIFLNIVAGASEELMATGQPAVAPYWRVVMADGSLPPKFPAGTRVQARRLRDEGHRIARGRVADPERAFVR